MMFLGLVVMTGLVCAARFRAVATTWIWVLFLGKSEHGLSRWLTATCSEGCQCFHLLEVDLFHRRRRHRNLRHLHRYCSEAC